MVLQISPISGAVVRGRFNPPCWKSCFYSILAIYIYRYNTWDNLEGGNGTFSHRYWYSSTTRDVRCLLEASLRTSRTRQPRPWGPWRPWNRDQGAKAIGPEGEVIGSEVGDRLAVFVYSSLLGLPLYHRVRKPRSQFGKQNKFLVGKQK